MSGRKRKVTGGVGALTPSNCLEAACEGIGDEEALCQRVSESLIIRVVGCSTYEIRNANGRAQQLGLAELCTQTIKSLPARWVFKKARDPVIGPNHRRGGSRAHNQRTNVIARPKRREVVHQVFREPLDGWCRIGCLNRWRLEHGLRRHLTRKRKRRAEGKKESAATKS